MICPKCKVDNDDIYSFCVECGTPFSNITESETVIINPEKEKLPPTEQISPSAMPTEQMPRELPPTVAFSQDEVSPTQQYTPPADTFKNEAQPTVQMSSEELPPTNYYTAQKLTAPEQKLPTVSVEDSISSKQIIEIPDSPQFEPAKSVTKIQEKPKKKRKFFLTAAVLLLLLLLGGGAAVYFLAKPMQADKSYILSDKHTEKENALQFDAANKTLLLAEDNKSSSQKWQITPDPNDKFYYRFVNRGQGEGESLEVVDGAIDTSVSMARSAIDTGQLWAITNVNGDYYRITNQWLGDQWSLSHSQRYYYFLRLKDSGTDDGQLWKKVDANGNTLNPTDDSQSFYLVNKKSGEMFSLVAFFGDPFKDKLAVESRSGSLGTANIRNHQWIQTNLTDGYVNLTTENDKGSKSLDVNATKNDRIIMNNSGSGNSQKWKLTPVLGTPYFRLTNASLGEGKSLESVAFMHNSVEMVKTSDDPGQLWKLTNLNK